jgi:hypothetical protein
LIHIHNRSTYQRIYNRFSSEFIDSFTSFRLSGLTTKEALDAARISLQILITDEICRNSPNKKLIIHAYKNLKHDTKLIENAIKYYKGMK